jgi:RNA polymerase sigma-70 factor (ECF subfamily)
LIQKLKSNDREAFYELVALYKDGVLTTCYRFLLNQEDAEDVSQEVFVEVYQSIGSFREESKLSTWIYRIAVTKCLNELKKRQRKKRFSALSKVLHIDEIAQWISGGTLADSKIHEEEMWKEVGQVLNKLPENQRVAYTLSRLDGFNNTEIADLMGTSIGAVESLLYRANKRVAQQLTTLVKK